MDRNRAFAEDRFRPMMKSTVQQIRERFDKDVERFSNLEVGQSAQIDSPLALDLVAHSAAATAPHASTLLDVGCGAGNFTLKLLQRLPNLEVTLIDLSRPMLDRAVERVRAATSGRITASQGDIRDLALGESRFDIIIAASVLHHLREDSEWKAVFTRFHAALRPGGWLWIHDFIEHSHPAVQGLMWERYGAYLTQLKDAAYRDHVFAYTEQEDTPRSLMFQLDLLRSVGFQQVEVLHKNNCFAAFGAMKGEG
jgi:tRNA (cmo5U34)-methyltransferase